ncbi:hypothetical protein [Manganibacter manganicus]|uniref:Flagellar export protein FliJ n=1 Tax=Manganibacter manganicus TaxID=1873176 RepID=A0A1V8RVL2_9HYPH|nr:hypothetical protein [Pseudaminobacter manganicus]OQM77059.1 hypothetical protein BFN67_11240 [Pseudaminobacter manganicus]
MTNRRERLKKLVEVQEQLKALHEARRAGHLVAAVTAEAEAEMLISRFNAPDSLAGMFPQLYHRRVVEAVTARDLNHEMAKQEAEQIAKATARTNIVERAYRTALAQDEREKSDRERLELIERKQTK